MSELDELINISRNIEKQNDEIIRLLKKIAGEDEDDFPQESEIEEEIVEHDPLLDVACDVGEVYFIDEGDVFRLAVKNNERTIDNLTSSSEPADFNLQEIIANESIKNNKPLPDATVILSSENTLNLPEILKVCVDEHVKNVYLPWSCMTQMIGAPDVIKTILNLNFYKTEEELLEELFG